MRFRPNNQWAPEEAAGEWADRAEDMAGAGAADKAAGFVRTNTKGTLICLD